MRQRQFPSIAQCVAALPLGETRRLPQCVTLPLKQLQRRVGAFRRDQEIDILALLDRQRAVTQLRQPCTLENEDPNLRCVEQALQTNGLNRRRQTSSRNASCAQR